MDVHHIINLTDEEISDPGDPLDRRAILTPAIQRTIAALGGIERGEYQLGDECYGCLKDLKKFWRKDDTDDERTVARIFWECRLLENDLVPILLETAGKGAATHKCAIAVADLLTAITWPIDLAEELTELDEERDGNTDYTTLIQGHLAYKAALLRPGVVKALIGIAIPCIVKDKRDRTEREGQVVNIILHLFRNLAFIKDLPPNTHLSADRAELSSLQSNLIIQMSEHLVLELLLTIASNALDDSFLNQWNCLILEMFYLLFRAVKPSSLAENQATQPHRDLVRLLETEERSKREERKKWTSSRHSRFGTTIAMKSKVNDEEKVILHKQAAVGKSAVEVLDRGKKTLTKRAKMRDALGSTTVLTVEAKAILQGVAKDFIISCFNPFLASLLKDIRSERPKVTEKDNLRLLFVTKWFIDFFLCTRTRNSQLGASREDEMEFALVVEVIQRSWAGWVIRRMREAWEDRPKQWTELQAGIECLTQLLLLVDAMSTTEDETIKDAAGQLQYQIYYNGEALERTMECMRSYKEQSFSYLDSVVHLSYVLLRMLERWGKQSGQMYIRRTSKKKKISTRNGIPEEEAIPDDDSDDEQIGKMQEMLQEMTLEKFESKFANEDITQTLLAYLSRCHEFDRAEQMKRVVNLMHRQAVKARAEGYFYKVSTLNLFRSLLSQRKTFPKDQCYKDLINLITYLLRQFFKAVEKDRMVVIEAFYPKNRGLWKNLSSWQPAEPKREIENGGFGDGGSEEEDVATSLFPPDIRVKRGHSWTEQLGIAIACLTEKDQRNLVEWTKESLLMIIGIKQLTIDEIDKDRPRNVDSDEELDEGVDQDVQTLRKGDMPSMEAMAKLEDFLIPYTTPWHSEAATKNPHLKLLWNLLGFTVIDKDAEELQWMCPASKMPGELDRSLRLINNYLLDPIDLDGKKATDRISKAKPKPAKEKSNRRRRQRTGTAPGPLRDDDPPDSDKELDSEEGWLNDPEKLLETARKSSNRKEKRKKEIKEFLSAQFIEDSDAELGNDDEFFAKEAAIRKRMEEEATKVHPVQSYGTKKRKKRQTVGADEDEQDEGATRRKRPRTSSPSIISVLPIDSDDERPVFEVSTPETSPLSISGKGSPPPLSSRGASLALSGEESFDASPVERRHLQQKAPQEDMDFSEEELLAATTRRPARRVINLSDEEEG